MAASLPERLALARELLRRHFGHPDFRPAQRRVVQSVLAGRDTLAVLPTGGGKSICFQIPALVSGGLTVVVSPLVSLMQDQVAALRARGIPAAVLNSTLSRPAQDEVRRALRDRAVPLVYVAPERLDRLVRELAGWGVRPALLAVDEAHCISEWGEDFRPAYRSIHRARRRLGAPPVVALTGSATPEVRADIVRTLGMRRPDVHLASFDRPNLWFGVRRVRDERERHRALRELLRGEDRVAIVYAATRNLTEAIARSLRYDGVRVAPYHAGLDKETRAGVLEAFLADELEVVVATCAFGMGIDKPSVRLVVHWTMPPTLESYYQEAGRAGRDGHPARCVLLYRKGDAELHRRQLEVTFPPKRLVEAVWRRKRPVGVPGNVLESIERLRRELTPERGPVDWRPVDRRRAAAERRIDAMRRYAEADGCRRAALLGYFGERPRRCSGCSACGAP
ncbi:MAG TPA: ATP-dependent DNA helicase RecQ, partial [Gemmatimonadales bacterium]|nr:ATP-dependent DNA helicase RecQ [Gemmatimonadales bacterium]